MGFPCTSPPVSPTAPRADKTLHLPVSPRDGRIRSLSVADIQALIDGTYLMEGKPGAALRGYIALGFGTGARPKELLNAELRNLDLDRGMFYVRHPKGEGSWGIPQWVPIIRGDMLPFLREYVETLKNAPRIDGGRKGAPRYLFPSDDGSAPVSGNTAAEIERSIGDVWKDDPVEKHR